MKNKKCECHGFEYNETEIAHKMTQYGLRTCPNQAVDSSLKQMGSGIQLTPYQMEEFQKLVLNK